MRRCGWVNESNELYCKYHDEEWGVPNFDDTKLFEFLILEGAQAGLSQKISKDLKSGGMSFVGPTIIYAYMQAIGMVNDHLVDCDRHGRVLY